MKRLLLLSTILFGLTAAQGQTKRADSLDNSFGRNFIAFNLADIIFESAAVSYEYIFPKGKIGIRVPISIGFVLQNGNAIDDLYHHDFLSGIDLNFYPNGQGKIRYFAGPSFQIWRSQQYCYTEPIPSPSGTGTYFNAAPCLVTYYAGLINNGVVFQPAKHFNISVHLGIGLQYDKYPLAYSYDTDISPHASFGINMGYKF